MRTRKARPPANPASAAAQFLPVFVARSANRMAVPMEQMLLLGGESGPARTTVLRLDQDPLPLPQPAQRGVVSDHRLKHRGVLIRARSLFRSGHLVFDRNLPQIPQSGQSGGSAQLLYLAPHTTVRLLRSILNNHSSQPGICPDARPVAARGCPAGDYSLFRYFSGGKMPGKAEDRRK